jgi:hypothetical protein
MKLRLLVLLLDAHRILVSLTAHCLNTSHGLWNLASPWFPGSSHLFCSRLSLSGQGCSLQSLEFTWATSTSKHSYLRSER